MWKYRANNSRVGEGRRRGEVGEDEWEAKDTTGELQPANVFNELNWFMCLAHIV